MSENLLMDLLFLCGLLLNANYTFEVNLNFSELTCGLLYDVAQINNAGTNKGFRPLLQFTDEDIDQVSVSWWFISLYSLQIGFYFNNEQAKWILKSFWQQIICSLHVMCCSKRCVIFCWDRQFMLHENVKLLLLASWWTHSMLCYYIKQKYDPCICNFHYITIRDVLWGWNGPTKELHGLFGSWRIDGVNS